MDNISAMIGENIRKFRKSRGMTREQLAEALELDTAYLGQCERGERQLGLTKTIEVIQYFGITANDIIPISSQVRTEKHSEYLKEINGRLDTYSDNQLLSILRYMDVMIPFLKK